MILLSKIRADDVILNRLQDQYIAAINPLLRSAPSLVQLVDAPPTGIASVGELGQIAIDSSYLYVCVDHNQWRRVALSTW